MIVGGVLAGGHRAPAPGRHGLRRRRPRRRRDRDRDRARARPAEAARAPNGCSAWSSSAARSLITVATYEGGAGADGHRRQRDALHLDLPVLVLLPRVPPRDRPARRRRHRLRASCFTPRTSRLDDAATRMVVTLSTLLVTGLLVTRLRRWLDGSLSDLTDRARLDSLSGLLNRRALEERAADRSSHARRRDESSVGMLIVDIDGFKAVNDSAGHHRRRRGPLHGCASARGRDARGRRRRARRRRRVRDPAPGADDAAAELVAERLRNAVAARRSPPAGRLRSASASPWAPTPATRSRTLAGEPTARCTRRSAAAVTRRLAAVESVPDQRAAVEP